MAQRTARGNQGPPAPPELRPEPYALTDQASTAERIAWVTAQLPTLVHDGAVSEGGGNYRYTSVDALAGLIMPLVSRARLAWWPRETELVQLQGDIPTRSGGRQWLAVVRITWDVKGPTGDAEQASSLGMSLDSSDKAINKAHRFAEKNALQAIFHPVSGEDPDAYSPQMGDREPAKPQPTEAELKATLAQAVAPLVDEYGRDAVTAAWRAQGSPWLAPGDAGITTLRSVLANARAAADAPLPQVPTGTDASAAGEAAQPSPEPPQPATAAQPGDDLTDAELGARRLQQVATALAGVGIHDVPDRLAQLGLASDADLADDGRWSVVQAAVAGWVKGAVGEVVK